MPPKKKQRTEEPQAAHDAAEAGEDAEPRACEKKRSPAAVGRGDDINSIVAALVAETLEPFTRGVTPEHLIAALQAIRETSAVLDPALSFPKAIQLLRDLKEARFEPFIAALEAVALVVSGPATTASIDDLDYMYICSCRNIRRLCHNYDAAQPLTHPVAVLASLCARFATVPLLEKPEMRDVASHFLVPLQGCEPFFMQLADMFKSVLDKPPTDMHETTALVLRNVSQSGKTYKSLAIVSGFKRLSETNDEYAWLKGRKVVPLYVGFGGGSAYLTYAPERQYIEQQGAGGLRAVLYARIAAAATAVANDPSLVALPENRGGLAKTLSVTHESLLNLTKLRVEHLKAKAEAALQEVADVQTLQGPRGAPPLVVIVVDEGQFLDGLGGALNVKSPAAIDDDGGTVNGSRLALRLCRELQADLLKHHVPIVGLMLGLDPVTALSTTRTGTNQWVHGEAELLTEADFAAFAAHRLPGMSDDDRAVICGLRYPRGRELPESVQAFERDMQTSRLPLYDDSLQSLIQAVRASLKHEPDHLDHGQRVFNVPYRGDYPQSDFFCMANLHGAITKCPVFHGRPDCGADGLVNVPLLTLLLRNVPKGKDWSTFEPACWAVLGIAAEFVMTGTLGEEIGQAAYEFLNVGGFTELDTMGLVDLSASGEKNYHPLDKRKAALSAEFERLLRLQTGNGAALVRTGGKAPWAFVLVINIDDILHLRYADARNTDDPSAPTTAVKEWHAAVAKAARAAGFKVSSEAVGAVISGTPNRSFGPHLTLDRDSWNMTALTDFLFRRERFVRSIVTSKKPTKKASGKKSASKKTAGKKTTTKKSTTTKKTTGKKTTSKKTTTKKTTGKKTTTKKSTTRKQ